MKNPFLITLDDGSHVEIGDPYILRHNGKYYLYCSTCDEIAGIRCFISDDLVNFNYYGLVAKDELLRHAYAPEVIYKDDEFIMATSPRGNGHYFLKSKSPLGPFEFITDNVKNMIDGSFINDKNNNLHFLRADHNGIAFLDYENGNLINRKDILPQVSKAWTEGPSITYFKDYYYATYCGNDVLSENYRIKVASSKYLDKEYKTLDLPLLLSTQKDFFALGHNSVILGPSMDEYFVCYHTLKRLEKGTTRYMCLDRMYFNKKDVICNSSNFDILDPLRPDFECDISVDSKLIKEEGFLLNKEDLEDKFTIEFNFRNTTSIILSYIDKYNYTCIECNDNEINIYELINGNKEYILNRKVKFNFNHFHSIRLINDFECELLIDNIPLFKFKKVNKGRIGYKYKGKDLFYLAYTKNAYLSSLNDVPYVLPGRVGVSNLSKKLKKSNEDIDYISLRKNDEEKIKVTSSCSNRYKVYARIKNKDVNISLSSSIDSSVTCINKNSNAYEFSSRFIGEISCNKEDEIKIKVLKGSLDVMYFIFEPILEDIYFDKENLKNRNEFYLLNKYINIQTLTFKKNNDNSDSLFGLIVNAQDFCDFRSVKNIKYHGYFVGFENNLLVVDYCQYDRTRIYDKPYYLKKNKKYKLKVEFLENIIKVYINDKLEIETDIKYDVLYGYTGVYKNKYSRISILNYMEGEKYEN